MKLGTRAEVGLILRHPQVQMALWDFMGACSWLGGLDSPLGLGFFGGSSWKTPKRPPENKLLQEWLDQELNGCWKELGRLGNSHLGGTLGNFRISLVVRIEAPCHKYLQGPQTYNPVTHSSRSRFWFRAKGMAQICQVPGGPEATE